MRILYILGDNGSGVEQVGWTFLGMLYKIGCKVDLVYTQGIDVINQYMEKSKDYDYVIGNDFPEKKMKYLALPKNFVNFRHSYETYNDTDIFLCKSLIDTNDRLFYYPFKQLELNVNKPLLNNFVGRLIPSKFPDGIMTSYFDDVCIDVACINGKKSEFVNKPFLQEVLFNSPSPLIYTLMKSTSYNINPTVSECFGLVFGESICNGCIPLTWSDFIDNSIWRKCCIKIENKDHFVDILNNRRHYFVEYLENFSYYRAFFNLQKSEYLLKNIFNIHSVEWKTPVKVLHGQVNRLYLLNASYVDSIDIIIAEGKGYACTI